MLFQWDAKNTLHLAKHGVTPAEAEYVVAHAEAPYPQRLGEGKFVVWGRTESGRLLQVIYVFKLPDEVDYFSLTLEQLIELSEGGDELVVRIIHAMELNTANLRRYRRKRRRK